MDCVSLPYSRIPKSSRLLIDYLNHDKGLAQFYNGPPFHPDTYNRLAQELRGSAIDRGTLVEILLRQNKAFGASEETEKNIHRLSDPDTFAVVTGQQVGLFLGPAFTLYKALSAVRLSQSLGNQGLKTVPVFWLATEDHDIEEVAQTYTLNEDYKEIHLRDSGNRPAPHSPVGRVSLTEAISGQIDLLEACLPDGDGRDHLIKDLRSAYQAGTTWSQAFAQFLTRLFGRWGVVLVDPLDRDIHQVSAPTYQRALRRAKELRSLLQGRSAELVNAGYHAQVHVAGDSTLLFAERDGNRLPVHNPGVEGKEFSVGAEERRTIKELESEIGKSPMNFSANVLLRPLVQDTLLPTIAYVAGPSELAYLAQASILYTDFKRPMPAIVPRSGFTLVDRRVRRWLEKYELGVDDVWQGSEHLNRKIASTAFSEGWSERFDKTERDLAALLSRLRKDVEVLDPTLVDALNHTEEKIQYQVERLKGKMTRSALSRSEILARHGQALLSALMPGKELQERRISGAYFLGHAGYALLDQLLENMPEGVSDHRILNL